MKLGLKEDCIQSSRPMMKDYKGFSIGINRDYIGIIQDYTGISL